MTHENRFKLSILISMYYLYVIRDQRSFRSLFIFLIIAFSVTTSIFEPQSNRYYNNSRIKSQDSKLCAFKHICVKPTSRISPAPILSANATLYI